MEKKFERHIKTRSLFTKKDKLLVAFSGGADSTALLTLLYKSGYSVAAAHCNFRLRGKEANADERFCRDFCSERNILFYSSTFKTEAYAKKQRISVQMAARELRFAWFEELINKHDFDYVLTAHHLNDNIETFFINLLRGSGIKGLKGIEPKKGKTIRPLLFAKREEIEAFLNKERIVFRSDSSNAEDKYLRNNLRLNIIPKLKALNPSLEETMAAEMEILQEAGKIIAKEVMTQRKKIISEKNSVIYLDLKKLLKTVSPPLILFELLSPYGFNRTQSRNIFESLNGLPGKRFESTAYLLAKDREFLILQEKENNTAQKEYVIHKKNREIFEPLPLKLTLRKGNINSIDKKEFNAGVLFADAGKISWPLVLSRWQKGDKFMPLGMKGFKKVSDFFISTKTNMPEKQRQWILRNATGEIIWLVGKRSDERFKISADTKEILVIQS